MFTAMSRSDDVPGSVRIRTGEGNAWRYDALEKAADYYGCNRSDAAAYACDDVASVVTAAAAVLERDDLTQEQREEIAERFNRARGVEFDVEPATVSVDRG